MDIYAVTIKVNVLSCNYYRTIAEYVRARNVESAIAYAKTLIGSDDYQIVRIGARKIDIHEAS